jgi:Uma2 family endonuclease
MSRLASESIGPYTWDDFIALGEDDLRELIDGELVEVEVPKRIHEYIVARLIMMLGAYVDRRGGVVLGSGYKIRISKRRGVMPDVQLYRAGNEPEEDQEEGLIRGRPDLVVEVVSPSSRRYDRIVKLGYYAALRVPEYWIVDPSERTLQRLTYSKKGYVIGDVQEGEATFSPAAFPGLKIRLAELWGPKVRSKRRPKRSPRRSH